MNPLAHLARRGPRPAETPPAGLGGADVGPGALSTLELERAPETGSGPAEPTDAYAADRFTVDPSEWGEVGALDPDDWNHGVPAPALPATSTSTVRQQTTPVRLLGRLALVVVLSLVAFHHSVGSLLHTIGSGSIVAYVLAVPLYGALAAVAGNRRPGVVLASGVRVRDVVLGAATCLVALGVTTLLGPGLSGVYGLWRLDLLMLWLFLLGATVLCFGLRQVVRSWLFWAVLLLLWPFPVRLANSVAGGAVGGALLLVLVVLAVVALGHRPHDPPRRRVLGSTALVGLVVLALSGLTTHPQRLLWGSVVATVVALLWWAGQAHRPSLASVPERRVRGGAVVLVALAVVGLLALPAAPRAAAPSTPTGVTSLSLGAVEVPGWDTTARRTSKEQQRYFGRTSTWQRISLRQDTGTADTTGRDIVVDVISTPRPQVLDLYPVVTTYPMGTLSSTPDAVVDLGHGVQGQVFRAHDAGRDIGYTLLTFSWRLPVDIALTGGYTGPRAQLTQRITLIAVDDQREDAPFPTPGNATLDGIRAAFASLGREPQVRAGARLQSDEQLLDDAARALVHQRLTGG
ncbi:hypothetical protein GCM10022197_02750 [Microlunatus spumicola]|uniref:Uncharacterized protein n=1 Tax=Microlunatus spumicola TaxID=81499 RepID=A0ABP6WG59_9ACTN